MNTWTIVLLIHGFVALCFLLAWVEDIKNSRQFLDALIISVFWEIFIGSKLARRFIEW